MGFIIKITERWMQFIHLLIGIHPKRYAAGALVAVVCGLLFFLCFPSGYETSVMGLVNDGPTENIGLIRFTESDTNAVNPYYKLRDDIAMLTDDKILPYEFAGKLSVEPGETYQNTLVLKLRSASQANHLILQEIIRKYNQRNRRVDHTNLSALDDSLTYVAHQLQNIEKGGLSDTTVKQPAHILDVLDALVYYVRQPVSQFAQLPNTFQLNDKEITELIDEYNSLQNNKQHLLNSGGDIKDDLLKSNRELLEVQQKLNTAIVNRRTELKNPGDVKKSREISGKSKDDLLLTYARLLHTKNLHKTQLNSSARLLIISGPVTTRLQTPYLMIVMLSLLAGILAPLAFDRATAAWKELSSVPDSVQH